MPPGATPDRAALEAEWLCLTRETLPALAASRRWPVRADHCFQRILLDTAVGGVWYDAIAGRPAYSHAPPAVLAAAVALARAAAAGTADVADLNRRSLAWRRQRKAG
ncbi:GCN5-related N-acetyltransferase [Sphingomonas sp. A2-49]|uniref:GCN5-related N-acetyltransferase n=1 Tax=Sphingomonas sp. A2-49 TaxID=1391375 RepID=UPI0021CDEDC1|nr:GCN5-related N-acetyltransferase [Sphingomonas sp. A2-49]MCU6452744.1 GCN5-related N-acetyltransferase [Sphingomonas sp. A2-49]